MFVDKIWDFKSLNMGRELEIAGEFIYDSAKKTMSTSGLNNTYQIVTSKIVRKDLLKEPGLPRSLFADFFSTTLSACMGSVPTTTYGENIGVMTMTKVYSVQVIGGAAVLSICCSFLGKLAALINTIPGTVIGGISFLLCCIYRRSFWNLPESGKCKTDRHGTGMCCRYGTEPGVLYPGQATSDK